MGMDYFNEAITSAAVGMETRKAHDFRHRARQRRVAEAHAFTADDKAPDLFRRLLQLTT
ncbi:hypothetical protein HFN86_35720 [Rhizobium laguerreae]|uniref:hypothetical protein n=1 Tax=Rhizobium laguerreae TaxID=1076926 RepID=UPI001C8FBB01|nr:hypothetical protein [Rhizobium laguerreae]MBY3425463.1 hypothetical protein [Rhizobium laguerreae]